MKATHFQAGVDGTYIAYTNKAGLFSYLLEFFKQDAMNTFSFLPSETNPAELPGALPHQVGIVILKSEFERGGLFQRRRTVMQLLASLSTIQV